MHSGHIRFLEEASQYGRVIVSLGSDENSFLSKGKTPVCSENERKYMLESVRFVDQVHISNEIGPFSFKGHLDSFQPDRFIINTDGDSDEKRQICERRGIAYTVLERLPLGGFVPRSSSNMRDIDLIPHRLDLAGGFFDQKKINSIYPGSAVIANIETLNLVDRAGMSSSTRRVIKELYGNQLPKDKSEQDLANIILAYENFDQEYISGATDAYGLVFSSVCRFKFRDGYRPYAIEKTRDNKVLEWLEQHLFLKLTHPRPAGYQVFAGTETYPAGKLREYAETSNRTWGAIQNKSLPDLIDCVNTTRKLQQQLIPGYISETVAPELDRIQAGGMGCKLMGAGGAGYVLVVSNEQPADSKKIVIRRDSLNL